MARICIVTTGQVGTNPRTVKEADALVDAGHSVIVIATKIADFVEPRDQSILASARWEIKRLAFDTKPRRFLDRLAQRIAMRLFAATGHPAFCTTAHSELTRRLTKAACQTPADLYIAHYVGALPAVAAAAKRHSARFAFDAEDFHPGDLPDTVANRDATRCISAIETRFLPDAAYVTAASPGIARAYAETYAIAMPKVVLNVFPRSHAPERPGPVEPHLAHPSIYWFSQTIGTDRGLECAIAALALSRHRPALYLRGMPSTGYEKTLAALAAQHGVTDCVHFLPPANPADMERLASRHTLGLVGETGRSRNRQIALTNKQFTYLLAGLPTLMSDIPAHRDFAESAEGAAFLFAVDNPSSLAACIDSLLIEKTHLQSARLKAWDLGQSQFNWESERAKLLEPIAAVFASE